MIKSYITDKFSTLSLFLGDLIMFDKGNTIYMFNSWSTAEPGTEKFANVTVIWANTSSIHKVGERTVISVDGMKKFYGKIVLESIQRKLVDDCVVMYLFDSDLKAR